MVGIDKINPATPYWKVNRKGEKQNDSKDRERSPQDQHHNEMEPEADDGKPHIDEYA